MRSFKLIITAVLITGLAFLFSSCSKDKDVVNSFPKDQLIGKWTTSLSVGGTNQEVEVELKANGVSQIDLLPLDGNPEFFGTWELNANAFVGHFTYQGNPDFIKFDATANATVMSGKLTFGGQFGTFAMTKK